MVIKIRDSNNDKRNIKKYKFDKNFSKNKMKNDKLSFSDLVKDSKGEFDYYCKLYNDTPLEYINIKELVYESIKKRAYEITDGHRKTECSWSINDFINKFCSFFNKYYIKHMKVDSKILYDILIEYAKEYDEMNDKGIKEFTDVFVGMKDYIGNKYQNATDSKYDIDKTMKIIDDNIDLHKKIRKSISNYCEWYDGRLGTNYTKILNDYLDENYIQLTSLDWFMYIALCQLHGSSIRRYGKEFFEEYEKNNKFDVTKDGEWVSRLLKAIDDKIGRDNVKGNFDEICEGVTDYSYYSCIISRLSGDLKQATAFSYKLISDYRDAKNLIKDLLDYYYKMYDIGNINKCYKKLSIEGEFNFYNNIRKILNKNNRIKLV